VKFVLVDSETNGLTMIGTVQINLRQEFVNCLCYVIIYYVEFVASYNIYIIVRIVHNGR